jgi:hypothetical protein
MKTKNLFKPISDRNIFNILSNYFLQIFIVLILFCLSGCIYSIHPLYTEKDMIFDPALIGEWSEKDSGDTWTFTSNDKNSYKLIYAEEGKKEGKFIVHLVKLKEKLFLDIYPDISELRDNPLNDLLLPLHVFMYVEQIQPALKMAMIDGKWLSKTLESNPKSISYEKTDKGLIFTSKTSELQTFFIKYAKTKDAFGELSNMTKKTIENTINKNTENKNF